MRLQQRLVAGTLVVVREAVTGVADLDEAAVVVPPAGIAGGGGRPGQGAVRRLQRVAGQHVLGVHHEQLLVLLLVVLAEHDQRGDIGRHAPVEHREHGAVHVPAVGRDLADARVG